MFKQDQVQKKKDVAANGDCFLANCETNRGYRRLIDARDSAISKSLLIDSMYNDVQCIYT